MRVAIGQFAAGTDVDANLAQVLGLMDAAAARGAELLLLPEASLHSTLDPGADLSSVAQPVDGPFIRALGERCSSLGLATAVGITESNPGGLPFNSVVVLDASGRVVARYRKVHLYDAFGYTESDTITPGEPEEPFAVEFGGLTFGAFTCYDLRFPESARRVVDAGADVLLVPANWIVGPGKEDQFHTLLRARAIENTAYVVAANQTGPIGTGHSIVVDPAGVVIAAAGEIPGVCVVDLEPERVAAVRQRAPSLRNRRFRVVAQS